VSRRVWQGECEGLGGRAVGSIGPDDGVGVRETDGIAARRVDSTMLAA
jgi:hypothetical protein